MIGFEAASTIGQEGVVADLIYDDAGRSFLVQPTSGVEVYSILGNDLEIHVDAQDRVVYVDGYCPREAWTASVASPPTARNGEIRVRPSVHLQRGESTRLTSSPTECPSQFNQGAGWVCVGTADGPPEAQAIRVDAGTILVVEGDQLVALWLRVTPGVTT